jgi:hypothetical protein
MGQDTILRYLSLLNVMWEGGEFLVDRRTKPSFQLRHRCLTFGLMVQPDAMRGFMDRAGSLPRGTGFIARFLIAWPASTQGTRAYRPAPAAMPSVAHFGLRITELPDTPLSTDAQGGLTPIVLDLSPAGHAAWVRLHDRIEEGLGAEGVVCWHLHEARRLLAELYTPPALAAAIRLDNWLLNEARTTGDARVPTTRIYQYGPACVRGKRRPGSMDRSCPGRQRAVAATAWPAAAHSGRVLRRCRPVAVAMGVDDPPKGGCIGPRALSSCTTPDSPAQRVQTNAHHTGRAHCDGAPVHCERHRSRADHAVPPGAAARSEFLRPVRRGRRCQAAAIRP